MLPRPIQHRRAKRTDFSALRGLLADAAMAPLPDDRAGLRRFRQVVADLGGDLYVAQLDDRIVGIVQVSYTRHLWDGQQADLAYLVVAPAERRRGIGRSLAMLAATRARRRGCAVLRCAPAGEAPALTALLTSAGWHRRSTQFEFDLRGPAQ